MTRALVLLVGLLVAVPATGETRAWVLWERKQHYDEKAPVNNRLQSTTWELQNAHPSLRDCETALRLMWAGFAARWQAERVVAEIYAQPDPVKELDSDIPGYLAVTLKTGQVMTWKFVCLPDTIDPRGPNGTAR